MNSDYASFYTEADLGCDMCGHEVKPEPNNIDIMAENFTKEQLSEYKEAFALFDSNSTGDVSLDELGTLVRSLGHNPSQTEIDEIVNQLNNEGKKRIDFGDFLSILAKNYCTGDSDAAVELKDAFKVFDKKGDGSINVSELVHILSTLGESLTEDEIERMFSEAHLDPNGEINYESFVKLITNDPLKSDRIVKCKEDCRRMEHLLSGGLDMSDLDKLEGLGL